MNTRFIYMGITLLVIALAIFIIVSKGNDIDGVSKSTVISGNIDFNQANEPLTDGDLSLSVDLIELVSVDSRGGSAVATRSFSDNVFTHTVNATVSDPNPGKFYEGWIVIKGAIPSNFISTGAMTKNSLDEWELVYTSDKDIPEYSFVVITEETSSNGLDNNPELHIFEGTFN